MESAEFIREALLAADPRAGSMYLQDMTFKLTVDIYAASLDLLIKASVDQAVVEVERRQQWAEVLKSPTDMTQVKSALGIDPMHRKLGGEGESYVSALEALLDEEGIDPARWPKRGSDG